MGKRDPVLKNVGWVTTPVNYDRHWVRSHSSAWWFKARC